MDTARCSRHLKKPAFDDLHHLVQLPGQVVRIGIFALVGGTRLAYYIFIFVWFHKANILGFLYNIRYKLIIFSHTDYRIIFHAKATEMKAQRPQRHLFSWYLVPTAPVKKGHFRKHVGIGT